MWARRRQRWRLHQKKIDPHRLVFVDETWTKTNMAPLRGWGRCGRRLIGRAPHGKWRTMTFIAALRADRIDAPFVFDGPIDGTRFAPGSNKAWCHAQARRRRHHGQPWQPQEHSHHKSKAIRTALRCAGAHLLFLPPYSPDLNPIEQVFAKLKHRMREAQERTCEATWRRIGLLLDSFQPHECANSIANAGYASVSA